MIKYDKKHSNQQGFTLIELLAAVTLLAIVIVSFLSFFSQSVTLSSKVDDELTASNVAEQFLVEVKNTSIPPNGSFSLAAREVNGKMYYPEANIVDESDLTEEEKLLGLKRVHVKVYTDLNDSNADAEVFGYMIQEEAP
ncbi:prepilin-type N-terminal cleavage/methylation domain-containing protein [Saliterribacillus persicus]|uniref:Type II secretion system protein I n=1 Tax=Saliterribacillus persicus TaxID=930114 RepID=A0A368XEL5_9BACI|nr:prepilin-type N-terminal cleavage/methylation domain-containing protein [Saliterribacillus persicus]RCW66390.1 type II secretion system protein I [Saliterribacillus persicus]